MRKKKSGTDAQVLELISIAKQKKNEISNAEKPNWKTNCSFRYNPEASSAINIQVCSDINILTTILGFLITQNTNYYQAANDLGITDATFTWGGYPIKDWKNDIQTRVTKIQINKKKAELDILESRLEKLVSPELRAQIELEELTALLK